MSTNKFHATLLSLLMIPGLALAQQGDVLQTGEALDDGQEQEFGPPKTFTTGFSKQFKTDIDDAGEFEITRFKANVGLPFVVNEEVSVTTMVNYDIAGYDFSDMKDPWSTIHTVSVAPMVVWEASEDWQVFGSPVLRYSGESGAKFDESVNGGALVGANYVVSPFLSIGGGLGVITQIEDDAKVVPVITANWQFAEDWRLMAGFFDVATRGVGATVQWKFHEDWALSGGAMMNKARFRLDNSPRNRDGVGQDQAFTFFGKLAWKTCPNFTAEGFVGVVSGEIRIEDSRGNKSFKEDYDPAALIGLQGRLTF